MVIFLSFVAVLVVFWMGYSSGVRVMTGTVVEMIDEELGETSDSTRRFALLKFRDKIEPPDTEEL